MFTARKARLRACRTPICAASTDNSVSSAVKTKPAANLKISKHKHHRFHNAAENSRHQEYSMNAQIQHSIEMTAARRKPFIAIVDDDACVCRSLKRLVKSHGIDAETFTSSVEFVDVIQHMQSFDPKCVILDMHMPVLNGAQVLGRLAGCRPGLPVIFLTGAREPGIFRMALACGAVTALRKPSDEAMLMANLRSILKMEAGDGTPTPSEIT
jgi:CheY-like chemotaxis protein